MRYKAWQTWLFVIGVFACCLVPQSVSAQWISGYWEGGNADESIANIPWSKYTHIIYFAAACGPSGTIDSYSTSQPEMANLVAAAHAAGKKILIVIGDGSTGFTADTDPSIIATFVTNIAAFVNTNNFDGVDLDYEVSPVTSQYVDMINRVRTALPSKIITVAVFNTPNITSAIVSTYLKIDQVNAMCYDLDDIYLNGGAKPWYIDAIFNGPLTVGQGGTCQARIDAFTNAGVPAAKMGAGIPYYGRRWTGATLVNQGTGTRAASPTYRDLVTDATRWPYRHYDATYGANYLSIASLNEFDSYVGLEEIDAIVPWVKSKGYGGYMVFVIDYEYLSGQSGDARYPLSTELYSKVFGFPTPPAPPTGLTATVQ